MYITNKFIYLHIPKTGGQSMNEIIRNNFNGMYGYNIEFKGFHKNIDEIELSKKENKQIYAVVRNPWRWYVCWYHFQMSKLLEEDNVPPIIFKVVSNNGKNDFKKTINNLFDMIDGDEDLRNEYKKAKDLITFNREPDSPLNRPNNMIEQVDRWNGCGLLSWNYHSIIFGNEDIEGHDYTNVTIGKQESSREDFISFLQDKVGFSFDTYSKNKVKENILSHERINVTDDYGDYKEYYDDSLIVRVSQKEDYIIEKYGYSFGDALSST